MGSLREYHVTVNGSPTTMLLDDKDAERLGGTLVADPAVVELPAAALEPEIKARRPANKARTARDKTGG